MKQTEALDWFETLMARSSSLVRPGGSLGSSYDAQELSTWVTEASSAISAVFPPGHAIAKMWDSALESMHSSVKTMALSVGIKRCIGAVAAARNLVRDGRLSSIIDGVKAETAADLLDQAGDLVDQGHQVAGAVIAGGALETFLHHLCTKHNRTWEGSGSIEKYKASLAAADDGGIRILDKTDGKLVTGWGGIRNDAAHKPAEFKRTSEEVRTMILGVTQFIARFAS